ncbi:OstA-like protein [Confluentibacter sediminis]|uniref:OstA-like protein n=1 Tax=Confluentibacter sediminis TaxID=2219045 RepID=UPI000DAE92F4|nr:OstA-like protein [Confluentibacter sediminis]
MKVRHLFYINILFFLAASINSYAQEKKKIEIVYSGRVNIDEANYPGAKILTRDDSQQVHILHENINLWCDKAIQYSNENFIEAYGNVKMIQEDTINMTSKYIEYSGLTQLAFASGDVVLKDPTSTITTDTLYFDRLKQEAFYRNGGTVVKDTSGTITSKIGRYYMNLKKYKFVQDVVLVNKDATINSNYFDFYSDTGFAYLFGPSTIVTTESKTYCEKGFYDTKLKVGYAMKNAKIDYDNREIKGDSLYFDNNKSFASATNNIKVTDTLNKSIVKGHYAEVFKEKDSVFITKRAYAITVQEKDSVYVHADTLMVTGKPEKRIIRGFKNVRMYKSDMSGKADSIHMNQETGLTQFINISKPGRTDLFSVKLKPILWNIDNQMTGDTIHLISDTKTEKLDSLIVFNNAFIISKDSVGTGYNQINGQKLIGLFDDNNELYNIDIIKNAQSIYYSRNDDDELIGIDKSKSGSINIKISDKTIDEVNKINQVDGLLYPESKFPDNEKLLKGFDWRDEERPRSVEDLFKDDPPLVLPIIKGLDDYVPQEDFFDEDMLERINQADEASKNTDKDKDPKASRNLPQRVKNKEKNNLIAPANDTVGGEE